MWKSALHILNFSSYTGCELPGCLSALLDCRSWLCRACHFERSETVWNWFVCDIMWRKQCLLRISLASFLTCCHNFHRKHEAMRAISSNDQNLLANVGLNLLAKAKGTSKETSKSRIVWQRFCIVHLVSFKREFPYHNVASHLSLDEWNLLIGCKFGHQKSPKVPMAPPLATLL